jgi:hypothetical protein
MRHTSIHSSAVTGCTERRAVRTSAMAESFGLAFAAARVTGFGMSQTARASTHFHTPVSSFGSGCASAHTSTMPTISLFSPE